MRLEDLNGEKLGLALGGGAVLGAAHIGVLHAFKELDITVSAVAGTSIGALVGSLFAFAKDPKEVEDLALDLSWSDITSFSPSKSGLFSNDKMKKLLSRTIGDVTFDQSQIPLAVIATDIETGEKKVLTDGNVAQAVMASTCIPGLFRPVEIDGRLLVDGGIVENVPISPLKEMGCDRIIAVDLNANQQHKRPENMADVLLNSFHFAFSTATILQTKDVDLVIKPDLSRFNRTDASQTKDLVKAGYEATFENIER